MLLAVSYLSVSLGCSQKDSASSLQKQPVVVLALDSTVGVVLVKLQTTYDGVMQLKLMRFQGPGWMELVVFQLGTARCRSSF